MYQFDYHALPWNIIFGAGALARLPGELDRRDLKRALVLSTPAQSGDASRIVKLLGNGAVGLFDQAVMHVPSETVRDAIAIVERKGADCSVSLGGGSTTGLGKALALKLGLPNIAIPTTYAGSEMTNIWGLTEGGRKTTGRDDAVVPTLTIYDPELTLSMPVSLAGPSGLNAMAQAVVNVASGQPNPIVEMLALQAIKALSEALPVVVANPDHLDARSQALYGACLAGASLGTGTTGLHHRLCHTFGGSFNTPHAETHTVLLPHATAYNAQAIPTGTNRVAQAMGVADAARGLFELAKKVGAPTALKDIGVDYEDLDRAAELATEQPISNPAPVTTASVRDLLEHAYHGVPPGST